MSEISSQNSQKENVQKHIESLNLPNAQAMKDEMQSWFDGEVHIDEITCGKYAVDWSIFKIMPLAVVYPKSADAIARLVAWVTEQKKEYTDLSLTARAAGTGMSGGSLNHGIIVDVTKYLNADPTVALGEFGTQKTHAGFDFDIAGKATVQPGVFYRDFETFTDEKDVVMPTFPASKQLCAVGGMVANNGAGEKSLRYGQNKDFVEKLKVVLSDGNEYELKPLTWEELKELKSKKTFEGKLYKELYALVKNNFETIQNAKPETSKNSSGYLLWDVLQAPSITAFEGGEGYFDITKLVVGAQGTTGLITEITYKLVKKEEYSRLLVVFLDDLNRVPELVETLDVYDLETLEMYDDKTFEVGTKFAFDFLKDKGLFGAIRYGLRFIPEVWASLTGGVPKLVVLAEFVSSSEEEVIEEVQAAEQAVKEKLFRTVVANSEAAAEKYWDFRHDSFKLLTEHSKKSRKEGKGTRTAPFIDDVAIPPKYLPEYLPKLMEILDKYKLAYTIAGHLGNGNFHVIPLMSVDMKAEEDILLEVSTKVYELAKQYNGTMSAEHNDGIVRTPFLPHFFGENVMDLFMQVKTIFDPQNIFNPGKKVGFTKEDFKKYLARE